MSPLTVVHMTGGAVGIVSGFTALFAGKGSNLHRRSGIVFVGAMLTMASTATALGNVFGGLIAIYLVVTALTTVRPAPLGVDVGAMFLAIFVGLVSLTDGLMKVSHGQYSSNGVPVGMPIALGIIVLLAAAGDFRVIRAGGIHGRQRIVRHLWRMCFSLWIAAGSFFTIRKRVAMFLPDPFLSLPVRMIPVILPLLAIMFWVWRIRFRKKYKPVRIRMPADAF